MSNASKNKQGGNATHALIFELEYVATNIRPSVFSALKSALTPKGVELTEVMYVRSGMSCLPRVVITDILEAVGKKADAIERATAELNNTVQAFCEKEAVLDKGLEALIIEATKRGVPVLTFTALPEEVARPLMDKLGLNDLGVELIIPDEVKPGFPRADSWLKMLKKCDKERATLVAVVSSQAACKGALTVGAACIAVPDQFTDFQDFSGAKLVLDSLGDQKPAELLDLTLRM